VLADLDTMQFERREVPKSLEYRDTGNTAHV